MSKLNQIDWSSYGYDFVRNEGWIPRRICLMRNKHIPAELDNTIKSERSLENKGGQQEVITDITNTISQQDVITDITNTISRRANKKNTAEVKGSPNQILCPK